MWLKAITALFQSGDEEDDYLPLFETKNEIVDSDEEDAGAIDLGNMSKFSNATTVEIKEQVLL